MKITHLIYSFTTGGSETLLVDIVNEQVNYAEVSIVIINKVYNDSLVSKIDKRVNVHFINRPEGSKNIFYILKINLLLLKNKADVLHCHNHNIAPLLVPTFRKKTVLTVHDVNITTIYFKQYQKLYANSKIVKKDIENRSCLNAVLVYNGICTEKLLVNANLKTNAIFKIVIVSRLQHEKKGQHLAIEALSILKQKGITNVQLDFIGEGESEAFLKELVVKDKLENSINFLGLKNRDYIYSHLRDYDLLIQPSLFEGFGLTVAEGMAAKVPVLVSDVDGPMEIIENGKYGYFFQSGNSNDLANKIIEIITYKDSESLIQKTEKAYNRVLKEFDIKNTAKNYLQNYIKI